jgi:hypothetical protein
VEPNLEIFLPVIVVVKKTIVEKLRPYVICQKDVKMNMVFVNVVKESVNVQVIDVAVPKVIVVLLLLIVLWKKVVSQTTDNVLNVEQVLEIVLLVNVVVRMVFVEKQKNFVLPPKDVNPNLAIVDAVKVLVNAHLVSVVVPRVIVELPVLIVPLRKDVN